MISLKDFSPRLYQENILKLCLEKNCLVVLPTGIGKTAIALLLAIDRLNKFKDSRILFCSPTKPLCQQHKETFLTHTSINEEDIILYTGLINAKKRADQLISKRVIVATPQTIASDITNNRMILDDFSLLVIDEAHRSRMKYANTLVAKHYIETAKNPRILALTASPGSNREKIKEICENLFIDEIEIRTEKDEDVKPYMQHKTTEHIDIELQNEFKELKDLFRLAYKEKLGDLQKLGFTKPVSLISKRDLLMLQKRFQSELSHKNPSTFFGLSLTARLLKMSYLIELLETQSLKPLKKFIDKLSSESTKAAKAIMNTPEIIRAEKIINYLLENNQLHPKMAALKEIIQSQLTANNKSKIIIFANYRDTIEEIIETLKDIENCSPAKLIGHKEGITQKQQLEIIEKFESDLYNCLVTTSIGEEGLSIGTLDTAIFYDNIPSGIRRIQREGRVGRIKPGKIIYITVKNSMDSAYYWKSRRDENNMKSIISSMKTKLEEQQSLIGYGKK